MNLPDGISEADVLRIAAEADVDPRTVCLYFTEPGVKNKVRRRIEAAAKRLGFNTSSDAKGGT